jgi:hypothetical protein
MVRPPRQPIDLKAATADVKARCARVLVNLEVIEQHKDPIFQDPRPRSFGRLSHLIPKPACFESLCNNQNTFSHQPSLVAPMDAGALFLRHFADLWARRTLATACRHRRARPP